MITLSQTAQKLTQKQTQCTEAIEFTICMGVQNAGKGELQPQLPKHPPLPQNVI